MKTTPGIFCFVGGALLVAIALGGLCAIGLDPTDQQQPGFFLDCALLMLFLTGYLACLLTLLIWVAGLVFGKGTGRKPRQGGEVE